MGNHLSSEANQLDPWWPDSTTVTETTEEASTSGPETTTDIDEYEKSRRVRREEKLKQFKADLEEKQTIRREAIAERSREIVFLRDELVKYKQENEQMREILARSANKQSETILNNTTNSDVQLDNKVKLYELSTHTLEVENDELKQNIKVLRLELDQSEEISKQNTELRKSMAEIQNDLQTVNAQVLEFEKERQDYQAHVVALKDVIHVSKQLLHIRENQLNELKTKITDIETSLGEREASMLSSNLRQEYERQLRNIRSLRQVYEERQTAMKTEQNLLASELVESKKNFEDEQKKNEELQERIVELDSNVWGKYEEIKNLESQLGLSKAEFRGLEAEMTVINQLFSQILYGFSNCQGIDFDKLVKLLEQNHDLLTDIVENEECESISSALPKVLLDLVNQVNKEKQTECSGEEEESTNYQITQSGSGLHLPTILEEQPEQCQMQSAEDIVTKLPKVWRVLIELLRQQSGQQPVDITEEDPCYKSVQTPKGPKLVLSVSKTYIRLKDLILEKKSLEKEMSRLKQLNSHLEVRLQDQEKRLETVSTELSKTWHVVGRMQKQHQQLHTHEKILRYELGQKRKMLTELKAELEYCREKWEQARQKNSNTEVEWKKLRSEFASRKTAVVDDLNNSAESGYSDERECSSDDESYEKRKKNKAATKETHSSQTSDTDEPSSHIDDINTIETETPTSGTDKMHISEKQLNQLTENILATDEKLQELHESLECSTSVAQIPETSNFLTENHEITQDCNAQVSDITTKLHIAEITEQSITENIVSIQDINEAFQQNLKSNSEKFNITEDALPERINETINITENSQILEQQIPERIELSNETLNLTEKLKHNTQEPEKLVDLSNSLEAGCKIVENSTEYIPVCEENVPERLDRTAAYSTTETIRQDTEKLTNLRTSSIEELNKTVVEIENIQRPEENIPEILDFTETETISQDIEKATNLSITSTEELNNTIDEIENILVEQKENIPEYVPEMLDLTEYNTTEAIRQNIKQSTSPTQTSNTEDSNDNIEKLIQESQRTENEFNNAKTDISTVQTEERHPSIDEDTNTSNSTAARVQTQEEMLARRDARLKRMEEQCLQLVQKVANTNQRGTQMSNHLESLHEHYGNDPTTSSKKQ